MSTVQEHKDHVRRIEAAQGFLNAAYAKTNAALTARDWTLVEQCRVEAQAALDAHYDALVVYHRMIEAEERGGRAQA